ncbi:hypothetical protein, partial [Actinocrinis sp.]|uniref:hypothetical protein n=1 Tax=Actinocrinis sp. TaxID=1920516 RepID=UPI002C5D9286
KLSKKEQFENPAEPSRRGSGQQPSKQTNGTTDKNVDTLLSSQETDTQVSLTSKAYQAIASLLPIFFSRRFRLRHSIRHSRHHLHGAFSERPI